MRHYRQEDLQKKLARLEIYPLDVIVTGVTGAGKSTTINSFFCEDIATVGKGVNPETMNLDGYKISKFFRIWDTPGLGDGVENDLLHAKKLIHLMHETYSANEKEYGFIDLVLVILDGGSRDLGVTYKLLNEIIVPNFHKSRILIALNQADMAMKGRQWCHKSNSPKAKLIQFLEDKCASIQERIYDTTGVKVVKPIYYSAEYNFNIDQLFDHIIDNMPKERRELI